MIPLLLLVAAQNAASHPFSIHDMLAMERLSGWEVAPDGKSLLFEQRSTEQAVRVTLDLLMHVFAG